jgi:hypothetical protein
MMVGWLFGLGMTMDGRLLHNLPPPRPRAYAIGLVALAALEVLMLLAPVLALLAAILAL